MQLKTILNNVQNFKCFVYESVQLIDHPSGMRLEAQLRSRSNSKPRCSICSKSGAGYDTLPVRHFEFVPLWGIKVFFVYRPRRVDCKCCGVKVEKMPWVKGKSHRTEAYEWFLASWAKRLSWKEVAEVFCTTWENVFRSVEMAVNWQLGSITSEPFQHPGNWC